MCLSGHMITVLLVLPDLVDSCLYELYVHAVTQTPGPIRVPNLLVIDDFECLSIHKRFHAAEPQSMFCFCSCHLEPTHLKVHRMHYRLPRTSVWDV